MGGKVDGALEVGDGVGEFVVGGGGVLGDEGCLVGDFWRGWKMQGVGVMSRSGGTWALTGFCNVLEVLVDAGRVRFRWTSSWPVIAW